MIKILLDANISWKLAKMLSSVFGECSHVDSIGITVPAQDIDIWKYAKELIQELSENDFGLLELVNEK
jgi:predicted nuclease of predicted toxin-antitoxin system